MRNRITNNAEADGRLVAPNDAPPILQSGQRVDKVQWRLFSFGRRRAGHNAKRKDAKELPRLL